MGTSSSKLTPNFVITSHPGLHKCDITQQNTLHMAVEFNTTIKAWWNTIEPLTKLKSHLFLPCGIGQINPQRGGCLGISHQEDEQLKMLHIYYDPYIYKLDRQIDIRKDNNGYFVQWEIWRLLKNCSMALYQWNKIYPQASIGNIIPSNILLNYSGQIKIVTQLSFPHNLYDYKSKNMLESKLLLPNLLGLQLILRDDTPGSGYYNIALTVLEVMTLERFPKTSLMLSQKLAIMVNQPRYSNKLRDFVLSMLNQKLNHRPTLMDTIIISKQQQKKTKFFINQ